MALFLSSSKWRRHCWTGLDPGKMRSSCSATSLGMPDMPDGFQAKVFVGAEEVDEREFLFGRQLGADPHHLGWIYVVDHDRLGLIG